MKDYIDTSTETLKVLTNMNIEGNLNVLTSIDSKRGYIKENFTVEGDLTGSKIRCYNL